MSDIGTVLKQEIARLARRELRSVVEPMRKASSQQRQQIVVLKRELAALKTQLNKLHKSAQIPAVKSDATDSGKPLRFVAKGLRSLRVRLGLSAPDLAKLLGVSEQSVYNWEQKKSVPRREQLMALAALRGIGKREIRLRLSTLKKQA
jgi:DNA-binding transcriptional regulator YiaG